MPNIHLNICTKLNNAKFGRVQICPANIQVLCIVWFRSKYVHVTRVLSDCFNGERLAQALSGRRVSPRSLALVLGVGEDAVVDYARGASQPAPESVAMMALFLGLPARFFRTRLEPPRFSGPVFERSRSEVTQSARDSARQRHAWIVELVGQLQRHIRLPQGVIYHNVV